MGNSSISEVLRIK